MSQRGGEVIRRGGLIKKNDFQTGDLLEKGVLGGLNRPCTVYFKLHNDIELFIMP